MGGDLFEQERRLGGHTNTVLVESPNGTVPLDTGFLVHNDRTYPNLVRLHTFRGNATLEALVARKTPGTNFVVDQMFRQFAVRDGRLVTGHQQRRNDEHMRHVRATPRGYCMPSCHIRKTR